MRTITATTVQIKQVQLQPDEACLVHDGTRVIGLAERGTVATAPGHTVLVGTKAELDAEAARLKLIPAETPDQRRARLTAAHRPSQTPSPRTPE